MANCDEHVEAQHYVGISEPSYSFSVWEVFCFPYTMLSRVCSPFLAVCTSQNACLLYWLGIQMIAAKFEQITSCGPLFFPYYYYVFGQCCGLTILFGIVWYYMGKKVVLPFFSAFWEGFTQGIDEDAIRLKPTAPKNVSTKVRKYCFTKRDLFINSSAMSVTVNSILVKVIIFMYNLYVLLINFTEHHNIRYFLK